MNTSVKQFIELSQLVHKIMTKQNHRKRNSNLKWSNLNNN